MKSRLTTTGGPDLSTLELVNILRAAPAQAGFVARKIEERMRQRAEAHGARSQARGASVGAGCIRVP